MTPEHLSKDQDIPLREGDDVLRGYYTRDSARDLFGVAFTATGDVDAAGTMRLRGGLKRSA
jgi:hypothetical protein